MVDSIYCRAMLEDIGDAQSPHFTILKEPYGYNVSA